MRILITLAILAVCALAWLFYAKFTRHGAVPLATAWRSYTTWLAAVGMAFGQYIVDVLRYLSDNWEPLRMQFGELLAADNTGTALQILSAIFLMLRVKAQGIPGVKLPEIPQAPAGAAKEP